MKDKVFYIQTKHTVTRHYRIKSQSLKDAVREIRSSPPMPNEQKQTNPRVMCAWPTSAESASEDPLIDPGYQLRDGGFV